MRAAIICKGEGEKTTKAKKQQRNNVDLYNAKLALLMKNISEYNRHCLLTLIRETQREICVSEREG